MTQLQPIDFAITPKFAKIRFNSFTFVTNPAGDTIANLLGTGFPVLMEPLPPATAPIVFNLPNLPKPADYFKIDFNFLSLDQIENTVLGGPTWLSNDLKAIAFEPGLGADLIEFDGNSYNDTILIGNGKALTSKYLKLTELRKITVGKVGVAVGHNMANYQTTTAFAPDMVGATNYISMGMQIDVFAIF